MQVSADQFEELCRPTQPVGGVAELIWNGLDAEADVVQVVIERNELDGLAVVKVIDDGHGMTEADADRDFQQLGGSWKKHQRMSRHGRRPLHGKRGRGRFRAFSLGRQVKWTSVAEGMDGLERVVVTGSLETEEFEVSDAVVVPAAPSSPGAEPVRTGTVVTATQLRPTASALVGKSAVPWLIAHLADYLARYPHVRVIYDGVPLDPGDIRDRETIFELDPALGGAHGAPVLRVMEWKADIVGLQSSIVVCDSDGVALHELEDLTSTGKLKLTGYLSWPGFTEHEDALVIGEMGHDVLTPILHRARQLVANYVADRQAEDRVAVLDTWRASGAYPYGEAPVDEADRRERQIFDAVAITAARAIPSDSPQAARLILRLVKDALETSPERLRQVLGEVLDLSAAERADLERLLTVELVDDGTLDTVLARYLEPSAG